MATWHNPIFNRATVNTYYNATDLNRVEENTQYLSDILNTNGYTNVVDAKYDYVRTDFFDTTHNARYINNLKTIESLMTFPVGHVKIPETLNKSTYREWNNIEKVQDYIYNVIDPLLYEANLKRAGTFYSGIEGGLI